MIMPEWDDIFTEQGRVFTKPHQYMKTLVQFFKEHGVNHVLDLGCGSGRHLVYLSYRGFKVTGLDTSLRAIELARTWLDDEGLQAEILQQRMEHRFPFGNASFDAIISTQVLHHNLLSNIKRTVREMNRVLRSGGVIFVTFPIYRDAPPSPEEDWNLLCVEENTFIPQSGPESGIPHHYFTVDEIHSVFNAFEILRIWIDETGHRCILGTKK
ncbi:class I SAM-dependent methyltransferase [Candidatus Thorarchaeota archaeon]|nr:MAG: class I SAM-dependent methyltransferase [Candidatus Thorarchaeota archaeon]